MRENRLLITGVLLTVWSVLPPSTLFAQSQTAPPCCVDRWDPAWTDRGMWGHGMMQPGQQSRMARHWAFMHGGAATAYRGQRSPLTLSPKVLAAGGTLYQAQCASCHGAQGMGDGEAGKSLNPSPALLAYMVQMPMAVDAYLLWSISEGGTQFGTDMPAFKDELSREEMWKIVGYMRAGFPALSQ